MSGIQGRSACIPLPERGIHDDTPADHWTDGFLTGNGELGAILYGEPAVEKVIFNHHRLVLPNGTVAIDPPRIAHRLEASRDLALAGDYAGASSEFVDGWELLWTQTYHPAYELRLVSPDLASYGDYLRLTDFRTGEVSTHGAGDEGGWMRRAFASRADGVVVHEVLPPGGGAVDLVLRVNTALDGVPDDVEFSTEVSVQVNEAYVTVHGRYPTGQGAYGYEGVTRVIAIGGELRARRSELLVRGAKSLLLLTRLTRHQDEPAKRDRSLHAGLAALQPEYRTLLDRHAAIHTPLYDRSRLDLKVGANAHRLTTTELIQRQNEDRKVVDLALLERLFDSGRYLYLSSSGVLPPRLTGIWTGSWSEAWAGDFTTDANVNLQVASGNILDLTETMSGYADLVLGQLDDWRLNARNLYGARGFLAPSRTDGEHGRMLHFNGGNFPGHCWTGGADWLLYPLIEYYQVTGDEVFLREKLGPAVTELALFYEDFLTRRDADGRVVFVPSFSMENTPGNTGEHLAVNATGDIQAARHALTAAIAIANRLDVEQGSGAGVERWTALLASLPEYRINSDGAIAEWSWPSLDDRYEHRHIQHLYSVWPLHEINADQSPQLAKAAARALELRVDRSFNAHGSLHRAMVAARLKDGAAVYDNLRCVLGNNMVFRSLMTSHNPDLSIYNADAANALPAVLAEALLDTRPGVLEVLPAVPEELAAGSITGLRGRNQVRVHFLGWDLADRRVDLVCTSDVSQEIDLICRRGIATLTSTAPVAPPSGEYKRTLSLTAGVRTRVVLEWPEGGL